MYPNPVQTMPRANTLNHTEPVGITSGRSQIARGNNKTVENNNPPVVMAIPDTPRSLWETMFNAIPYKTQANNAEGAANLLVTPEESDGSNTKTTTPKNPTINPAMPKLDSRSLKKTKAIMAVNMGTVALKIESKPAPMFNAE